MVRTQIQLTESQVAELKALSASRDVSMAELIRASVDDLIRRESGQARKAVMQRALAAAGKYASGKSDISTNHDHYLAQAFEES
jgi:Arc/MetJ-type ribon-helix-helix transcriptional regulator